MRPQPLLPLALVFAAVFCVLITLDLYPASSLADRPWFAVFLVLLKAEPALFLATFVWYSLPPSSTRSATSLALALCSLGDAALEVERTLRGGDVAFLAGLGSFLVAHIVFARGYLLTAPRFEPVIALAAATPPLIVLRSLWPHVGANPAHAPLKPAIVAYGSVLALLLYAAVVRTPSSARNWVQTVGGVVVFLLSDAVLAWDRFAPAPTDASGAVRWWWHSPSGIVMVTYYTAITLLATAAVLDPSKQKPTPTSSKVTAKAAAKGSAPTAKDSQVRAKESKAAPRRKSGSSSAPVKDKKM